MDRKSFISRYHVSPGLEGTSQPGSHGRVLANLKGLTSKNQIDAAEYKALLAVQIKYLSVITAKTVFTRKIICRMHRDWLGRLYVWAGKYRTVEMSKGNFHWPPAYLVPQNMAVIERQTLKKFTPCLPAPLEQVADALAHVQADLLLIHPFREGNGRLARWITDLMAMQAGLPAPDYAFTQRRSASHRQHYLECVIAGYAGNYDPLTRFLSDALRRALREGPDRTKPRAPSKTHESKTLRRTISRPDREAAK